MKQRLFHIAALMSLTAAIVVPAAGQSRTAEINGRITDASGGAVVDARIDVRNLETGARRTVNTSGSGDYTATLLEPGTYEVRVERAGFRTIQRSDVGLHVNDSVRLDFTLQIGEMNQTVTVVEAVPLLRTTDSSLGQIIDNTKVTSLPLNGRSSFRLVELTPATSLPKAQPDNSATSPSTPPGTRISLSTAARVIRTRYDRRLAVHDRLFQPDHSTMPSVDSLVEFKVESSSMSAEFGRFAAAFSTSPPRAAPTRCTVRCSNSCATASWTQTISSTTAPGARREFQRNQFGGSIGGPLSVPEAVQRQEQDVLLLQLRRHALEPRRRGPVHAANCATAAGQFLTHPGG